MLCFRNSGATIWLYLLFFVTLASPKLQVLVFFDKKVQL